MADGTEDSIKDITASFVCCFDFFRCHIIKSSSNAFAVRGTEKFFSDHAVLDVSYHTVTMVYLYFTILTIACNCLDTFPNLFDGRSFFDLKIEAWLAILR